MILGGIGLDDLIVEPHVSDSHAVLGQSSGLIRADGRSGSKGLDGFQVLDQAVLAGHALGRKRQTDGDSGQKTFRHVGHDDADQEDDSIQPLVAQAQGDDEESDTQKDSHARDDVDEVLDLTSDGRFARLETGSQSSDAAHDRVVADVDDDTACRTWTVRNSVNLICWRCDLDLKIK